VHERNRHRAMHYIVHRAVKIKLFTVQSVLSASPAQCDRLHGCTGPARTKFVRFCTVYDERWMLTLTDLRTKPCLRTVNAVRIWAAQVAKPQLKSQVF